MLAGAAYKAQSSGDVTEKLAMGPSCDECWIIGMEVLMSSSFQ
ncbi:hypothetical protein N9L68_08530 [bacterium]|nr:hypothetical protein [bacterium]